MKNKKQIIPIVLALVMGLSILPFSCKENFLEVPVTGELDETQVQSLDGLEGLLIGTYSVLNGRGNDWHAGASNWMWGSIRGGEANKGTNAGDFNSMNPVQRFELDAVNSNVNYKWSGSYEGVSRANSVLANIANVDDASEDDIKRITAEARFLRAHYYFELKKHFQNVPWVDETMTDSEAADVGNKEDIWPKIQADFEHAYTNLPETQSDVGRANKWAAASYLGKALLYQKKYDEAKVIFDEVISKGMTSNGKKYGLVPRFEDVFKGENENHEESIFAFQAAAGTGDVNNTNVDLAMNYPYNTGPDGPGECCGFYAPSFELINSYRTDANGLPYLDGSYKESLELVNDQGIASNQEFTPDQGNLDPRLDLTIGRRYIQFLDWMPHPGADWIRDQSYAGPYTQKKYSYRKSDRGVYQDGSSWTPGYHAINFMIIRYADVLLMAAEAEIEAGSISKAIEYINQVRTRAANPSSFVKGKLTGFTNGDFKEPILDFSKDAANYVIGNYPTTLSKSEATAALRFERKLELALEGQRFFDLVRWGVDVEEVNEYLTYESKKLPTNLSGATYTATDAYLPIPQRQIDLQGADVLDQNDGY